MERWTRFVLRRRRTVLAVWLAVFLVGGYLSLGLGALLSNEFTVPGTDSERAREILHDHFDQRDDGTFLVVFRVRDADDASTRRELQAALARGATAVPGGVAQPLQTAGDRVLFGQIASPLRLAAAKNRTGAVRDAVGDPPATETFVSGSPAIQADLDPIFAEDLLLGEAIALPVALAVLLAVFGLSLAVLIPFLLAACTITATLGVVWGVAHVVTTATYVTNLVQLIGLAIAIDYSLLVVYRFREELARREAVEEAVVRTMATAGRAVVFSGATVAIGLALLVFMPLPFMQSMGIGGFLIPVLSIAAALTLQPVLLALLGRRGARRVGVADLVRRRLRVPLPRYVGTSDPRRGFWARLARSIMRRPLLYLAVGGTALVAAALPVLDLELTPGSTGGTPRHPESIRGLDVLSEEVGPGAIAPALVVVDAGRSGAARTPAVQASLAELLDLLRRDPYPARVDYAPAAPFVDRTGRFAYASVAGRYEYGAPESQAFARRLRAELVPAVEFPPGTRVLAGGGPAQGIDFIDRSYGIFPWLVLAVLLLTFVTLMRAFRSIVLPLKAVILNLLAIGATYGILVVVFRYGAGESLGLYRSDQVEAWIPIFLFAMLFGLSMDYEVFLVTRMREFWDAGLSNEEAVAAGLERTGRIVTAAAIIMVAAFCGLAAGRIIGLQEFGLGLAIAIFLDATLIRAVLVPALMRLFGRYNWWLPAPVARVLRVPPSPLRPR
ncbi:MAG TPA: MMPL family transporter [Gaiellaceae bacterium]|nr:MMPL family transporter [Gaiellaceae bacterium]